MSKFTLHPFTHFPGVSRVIIIGVLLIVSQPGFTANPGDDARVTQTHPSLIALDNVGAGPNEQVKVLIVNGCDKAAEVQLVTTVIRGEIPDGYNPIETIQLEPESSEIVLIIIPGSPATDDRRRYVNLKIQGRRGDYCSTSDARLLRAAVAVENSRDGTVHRSGSLRSDGDLVQAVSNPVRNSVFTRNKAKNTASALVRVGEGESIHLVMKNHLKTPLTYHVNAKIQDSDERLAIPDGVLKAGGAAVIPLGDGKDDRWIIIESIDWGSNKPGGWATDQFRQNDVSASIEVFNNNDGNTRYAQRVRARGVGVIEIADDDQPVLPE